MFNLLFQKEVAMGHAAEKVESKQKVHAIKPRQAAAAPMRAMSPFEQMERMLDEMVARDWLQPWRSEWPAWAQLGAPFEGRNPKVDIIDRDEELVVQAELPGVEKKDLDVTLTDTSVTINGETRKEAKEEQGDYYRCEISQGAFARTLTLPAEVDSGNAKAIFKDGMLELKLPKRTVAKRRTVTIE